MKMREKLLIIVLFFIGSVAEAQTLIVVNPFVEESSIDRRQVKNFFTLKSMHWQNGKKAHVVTLPKQHLSHVEFCKKVLHITPRQLERKWNYVAFTGKGTQPTEVLNELELLKYISKTPYAIGYLNNKFVMNLPDSNKNFGVVYEK